MNTTDWKRMWTVFDAALDHSAGEARRRYVRGATDGDVDLEKEVLSLLDAHQAGGPLDREKPIIGPAVLRSANGPAHESLPLPSAESLKKPRKRTADQKGKNPSSPTREAPRETSRKAPRKKTPEDPPPPEHARIGPYAILEEIGRGGMGVVYKARDERLDRLVAVKTLPHHMSADSTAKTRFIAEARAAAALEHPNIATVYDIGEGPDGRLYIAMAFYEGETLLERIERGPLDLHSASAVARQIAAGLERAHAKNIVHRDVKPANILLEAGGAVKILDFGIAKMADMALTGSGVTIGTIAYMSPEQASGRDLDHRSDLWSLGVVLYEMLAGRRPFDGSYQGAVLYSILHEDPEPLSDVRPDVPQAVADAVARLLRRDPNERFASAGAFSTALEVATDAASGAALAGIPGTPAPRERRQPAGSRGNEPLSAPSRQWMPGQAGPERIRATVLVSQLHGYSNLIECLVPEALRARTEAIRSLIQDVLETLDGFLYHFEGESIVALFGIPEAHEDDFVRAVRAARDLHARLHELSDELEAASGCRLQPATGVDVGILVVHARTDRFEISGDALHVATQLSLHAETADILMSPECERLVRPFFETRPGRPARLKGRSVPITPYRVAAETGLETRLEASEKAGMTAYSGRDVEMEVVEAAYGEAKEGRGQFVTVVGEAGLGKSRLLYEFRRRIEGDRDTTVFKGRCQPYGSKVAYLPFVELLRQYFGISSDMPAEAMEGAVVGRIAAIDPGLDVFIPLYLHVLSIASTERPLPDHLEGEDLRMATVEALAGVITLGSRQGPSVVLLEDWHWADEGSQDVLKQVAELSSSYPLMVVVTYRPEHVPRWRHGGHHTTTHLKPLDEEASGAVIRSVLEAESATPELVSLLHERTGGNPFFLEEICRTLLEEGAVVVEGGVAVPTRPLDALDLPDTVQAVIRSRLHRLDHRVRKTLRVASVIGREFSGRVLSDVLPDEAELSRMLVTLRDLGLIQQIRILPEPLYRFKHVLTQEVAYDSLLQHQRKTLHLQVGETIERIFDDRRDEHLDLLVHHFQRAEDWQRAARYGEQSAKRAVRMSQFPEAAALLENVRSWLRRLPDEARSQNQLVNVLLEHERVCETIGDRAEQQQILDELLEQFASNAASATLAEVYRRKGDLHVLRRRLSEAEVALEKATSLAAEADDPEVERRILRSFGFLRWHQGRSDQALEINERVLALHRECGDDRAVVGDLVNLCIITRDEARYDDALAYLRQAEEVLEGVDNPYAHAYIQHSLGSIYQLRGEDEEALAYFQRARDMTEKHRLPLQLSFNMMSIAHLNLRLGRVERSLEYYREAIALTRRSRYADGLAKSLLVFGDVLHSLERFDEALDYLIEAADWFRRLEDAQSEADTLKKIASIYENQDRLAESEETWRRLAGRLGALDVSYEIDTLEAFAGLARRRGDADEALAHFHDAIDLSERASEAAREARLRNSAGILEWQLGEYDDALHHYERALTLFTEIGDADGAGLMMNSIGLTLHKMNRAEDALGRLRSALEAHRASGHQQLEAHALAVLGDVHAGRREFDEALEAYAASLQMRWELDDRRGEGWMLHHMAVVHAERSEFDRAGEYADQASAVAAEIGDERLLEASESVPRTTARGAT